MAFKLTQREADQRDSLVADLELAGGRLSAAIATFNAALAEKRDTLTGAVDAYNEKVEAAREFAEDIASRAEDEYDSKSEKWRESYTGCAAEAWRGAWGNLDMDALELEIPADIEDPDPSHRDDLDNAPQGAAV